MLRRSRPCHRSTVNVGAHSEVASWCDRSGTVLAVRAEFVKPELICRVSSSIVVRQDIPHWAEARLRRDHEAWPGHPALSLYGRRFFASLGGLGGIPKLTPCDFQMLVSPRCLSTQSSLVAVETRRTRCSPTREPLAS